MTRRLLVLSLFVGIGAASSIALFGSMTPASAMASAAAGTSTLQSDVADHTAATLAVDAVASVGMTVSDMDRSVAFYTEVLDFTKVSDVEVAGRSYELLHGVFGARMRVVQLRLGAEVLELTEYLTPKGRPVADDMRPNDLTFQHIAIIVSDMDAAYMRLRRAGVMHASTGPQLLPEWNTGAAGISAFYFRDPDKHFLEILHFPAGKGTAAWHRTDRLFLGIDHTAIVVSDTDRSLLLYRDSLGMKVAGESENYDTEQEHLNNVFGARLRITAVRAAEGPGIEFLEYLAPSTGRPAAADVQANDIAHWQTTMRTRSLAPLISAQRSHRFRLVSPGSIVLPEGSPIGFAEGALLRDLDGHGIRLTVR